MKHCILTLFLLLVALSVYQVAFGVEGSGNAPEPSANRLFLPFVSGSQFRISFTACGGTLPGTIPCVTPTEPGTIPPTATEPGTIPPTATSTATGTVPTSTPTVATATPTGTVPTDTPTGTMPTSTATATGTVATATPTGTPTATSTATPTGTLSPTSTLTPTGSPTATPTATATTQPGTFHVQYLLPVLRQQ
jgi:hypothetical protein